MCSPGRRDSFAGNVVEQPALGSLRILQNALNVLDELPDRGGINGPGDDRSRSLGCG
jgi:hypothetical protein